MYDNPPKESVSHAHGKLIMVGEHSVVYGQPAIALPFPVIEATSIVKELVNLELTPKIMIDSLYFTGSLEEAPRKMSGISACILATLETLDEKSAGLEIHLSSTIPVGRGLGSSAAVAIAIVKSLFSYYEKELSHETLMTLVQIAEKDAHGNPSGIDMAAASRDFPIWFQKEQEPLPLEISATFYLIVADTGQVGKTRMAVESIRDKYQLNPVETKHSIDLLGDITYTAKDALLNGDLAILGSALNAAQKELASLGVSDEGIDNLVEVARATGALGAKLTGGGRGGCVIALAKDANHASELAQALEAAGAYQTWNYEVEKTN